MPKKTTQIHIRRPRDDGLEHVPPSLQVYGTPGQKDDCCTQFAKFRGCTQLELYCKSEQEEDCCAQFAKFWGCTQPELYFFMILYAIILMVLMVLLCLRFFMDPSLPGRPNWLFVLLPLIVLVDTISMTICFYVALECCCRSREEKRDTGDRELCSASCVCRTLLVVVLWLIGWGVGALGLYLQDDNGSSPWLLVILIGFLVHFASSGLAFGLVAQCCFSSRSYGG
jgi:hypothetical protein